MKSQHEWWREATIYQIYPKSFNDSATNGHGDIKGITAKLDYLKQLGVSALWLCPVYSSPQIDNGYDISDYYSIDLAYGTMADFEQLLAECQRRDLRIIMDIVVNHTSTEHPWFKEALADPTSPKRDFYIWRNGHKDTPPTNWTSKFGGNAWQKDQASNQYYLHLFAKEQADLNWENPELREQVCEIMRFWANKGMDGFRLDVINLISKDQNFPNDNGKAPQQDGLRFYTDGPKVHQYLHELNQKVFKPFELMTVGEMSSTTLEQCQLYSAPEREELSMVFNFHHLKVDYPNGDKWQLAECDWLALKTLFTTWQQGLHKRGWNALFWCNHDQPRIVSRFGDDNTHRVVSAKMLATGLHLLQGTPFIYQGEEIGMTNPHFDDIAQYRDVETHNIYRQHIEQGQTHEEVMAIIGARSRDNGRTPMQWDSSKYAGFSKGTPWLDVAPNYKHINVEAALNDPDSIFYHYQKLIAIRKQYPIIIEGNYQDLFPLHDKLWCYTRSHQGQRVLVANNVSPEPVNLSLAAKLLDGTWQLLISNYQDSACQPQSMTLRPYESIAWMQ